MVFQERKGSISNQMQGLRASHLALIGKLMSNAFKADVGNHTLLLRLIAGDESKLAAMNDLETYMNQTVYSKVVSDNMKDALDW